MNGSGICLTAILVAVSSALLISCSNEPAQKQPQQQTTGAAPAAAQPAVPASQPAQPAPAPAATQPSAAPISTGKPAGPLATEKHSLSITNYAGAAVTATLNGVWVGQWDSHAGVPLDSVVQGKNELRIDLAQQANNEVTVEVNVARGGQSVNLLRLNFKGKPPGSYTYYFVAR